MNKFTELDDSRRAMYSLDAKKAKEKGLRTPKFRPRSPVPKPATLKKKSNEQVKATSRIMG